MLGMHYLIPLSGADAVAAVRRRAAERGPLFDGMAGLAEKFFLVDPADPAYATFYLWHDPQAALGFLQGSFFAALAETFGRPEVRLLLPSRIALPPDEPASAVLADIAPDRGPAIATLDPISGHALSLVFAPGAPGRRFDVMYHARGTAGPDHG
jgi:uncharacterized protein DUF4865